EPGLEGRMEELSDADAKSRADRAQHFRKTEVGSRGRDSGTASCTAHWPVARKGNGNRLKGRQAGSRRTGCCGMRGRSRNERSSQLGTDRTGGRKSKGRGSQNTQRSL